MKQIFFTLFFSSFFSPLLCEGQTAGGCLSRLVRKARLLLIILLFGAVAGGEALAQQTKGFQWGLYVGAFFANNNTATIYDGYGYDSDGNKNDFDNSSLNRKINYEYGGGNGQLDRIAPALNVGTNEWNRITEEDMPVNMQYTPAFMIGLNCRYNMNKSSALLFNLNTARISATGNFTIELTPSVNQGGSTWSSQNIQTFQITGTEQRFVFQAGLQRFFSQNEIFNFFVEAGPLLNMIKAVNNKAIINSLQIDLNTHYNEFGTETFRAKNMTAVDFGFFGSIGINLNTKSDWIIQVLYNPSYERIGIGENPGPYLQNALGLRMYKAKGD